MAVTKTYADTTTPGKLTHEKAQDIQLRYLLRNMPVNALMLGLVGSPETVHRTVARARQFFKDQYIMLYENDKDQYEACLPIFQEHYPNIQYIKGNIILATGILAEDNVIGWVDYDACAAYNEAVVDLIYEYNTHPNILVMGLYMTTRSPGSYLAEAYNYTYDEDISEADWRPIMCTYNSIENQTTVDVVPGSEVIVSMRPYQGVCPMMCFLLTREPTLWYDTLQVLFAVVTIFRTTVDPRGYNIAAMMRMAQLDIISPETFKRYIDDVYSYWLFDVPEEQLTLLTNVMYGKKLYDDLIKTVA